MNTNDINTIIDGYLGMLSHAKDDEKQELLEELRLFSNVKNIHLNLVDDMKSLNEKTHSAKYNMEYMNLEEKINYVKETGTQFGNTFKKLAEMMMKLGNDEDIQSE